VELKGVSAAATVWVILFHLQSMSAWISQFSHCLATGITRPYSDLNRNVFFNFKLQTPPNKVARILTSLSHDGAVGGFWTEATYSHGIHGIMSTRSTG